MRGDIGLLKTVDISMEPSLIILRFKEEIIDSKEDTRLSQLVVDTVSTFLHKHKNESYCLIIDLSAQRGGSSMTREARQKYADLGRSKQIRKAAIVGGSTYIRTVAGFILRLTGRNRDYKWFDTVDEAKQWLACTHT